MPFAVVYQLISYAMIHASIHIFWLSIFLSMSTILCSVCLVAHTLLKYQFGDKITKVYVSLSFSWVWTMFMFLSVADNLSLCISQSSTLFYYIIIIILFEVTPAFQCLRPFLYSSCIANQYNCITLWQCRTVLISATHWRTNSLFKKVKYKSNLP